MCGARIADQSLRPGYLQSMQRNFINAKQRNLWRRATTVFKP
jgi:hypothetical protein